MEPRLSLLCAPGRTLERSSSNPRKDPSPAQSALTELPSHHLSVPHHPVSCQHAEGRGPGLACHRPDNRPSGRSEESRTRVAAGPQDGTKPLHLWSSHPQSLHPLDPASPGNWVNSCLSYILTWQTTPMWVPCASQVPPTSLPLSPTQEINLY